MSATEEKESDEVIQKGESLSKLLLKMYRFAYDSISKDCDIATLKEKYFQCAREISELPTKQIKKLSMLDLSLSSGTDGLFKDIINAIQIVILSAKNEQIYQQK